MSGLIANRVIGEISYKVITGTIPFPHPAPFPVRKLIAELRIKENEKKTKTSVAKLPINEDDKKKVKKLIDELIVGDED